ncbi:MAG: iron chelate uptake ABC transporter family permease subunit [Firmicutes bacterium]|nr:iron chelate uptake ABC transporter family permease subunit [Bacillota bacterium]
MIVKKETRQGIKPLKSNNFNEVKRCKWILPLLIGLLIALAITSLFVGPISIASIFRCEEEAIRFLRHHYFPRTLAVLVAGVGMSICGLIMQAMTSNKFVSPTTAGTLEGARLGILLALLIVPAAGLLARGIFAFTITMASTALFIVIIERIKIKNTTFVPLVGIIYGGVLASITTLIALRLDIVQLISVLLMGDFSFVLSGSYELILLTIPLIVVAYFFANYFMIAGLGADFSKNLGVNYKLTMGFGLAIVAAITTLVLLTAGIIPFLGLVIPNIVSIYRGDNLKKNLPYTAVLGGIFLLVCDIIARVIIYPFEVPVSLVAGVVGAVLFLGLLFIKRNKNKVRRAKKQA